MGHGSFNTLRHRGDGPPVAERPPGTHGHYTYYWAADVDQWLKDRAKRANDRGAETARRRAARTEALAGLAAPVLCPDWPTLLAALDARRGEVNISWDILCRAAHVSPYQVSRIRNGRRDGDCWAAFFRLVCWLHGVPEDVRRYIADHESEAA